MSDPTLDPAQLIDIGISAAWSVSSSKPGFGVGHVSDPNLSTLWQSEGPQPHLINIQFSHKESITQIDLYADVGKDDSYTPQKISIRTGTHQGDLHEVRYVDMQSPEGWQHFRLGGTGPDDEPIRAHLLQIAIISNHLNGKDTHVRGVRVFAQKKAEIVDDLLQFTSVAFLQHGLIR